MTPEQKARVSIDALLQQAGWHVCDMAHANIHAARGVAIREFPLNTGFGFADYLLYIDGKAAGVIEAKKEGSTLTGVEVQSARYAQGLPATLPAWVRPLPFSYESTGIETHFTQGLDPQPRARSVFAFHRPETLAAFLKDAPNASQQTSSAIHTGTASPPVASDAGFAGQTFLARLQHMPPLIEQGLWPAQTEPDKLRIVQASGGYSLKDLARNIVNALDPDFEFTPSPTAVGEGWGEGIPPTTLEHATKPLCDPTLRNLLIDLKQKAEQIIDTVTQDSLLEADFSEAARERAKGTVESFERFIAEHKDEITALQILYNRPQRMSGTNQGQGAEPLTFEALKTLADALQAPPHLWTEGQLWQAYAALDKSKVKGENRRRILTDLVSLVRFAMHQDNELVPFPERVNANFKAWLAQSSTSFTPEQLHWLEMIRDHIAANLGIEPDDFEYSPFAQEGGIGKVHQLFGAELPKVLEAMNRELAA